MLKASRLFIAPFAAVALLLTATLVVGVGVASASSSAKAKAATSSRALSSLRTTLRRDLLHTTRHGSVLVYDQTARRTLFSWSANTARLPASIEKLYTTTSALYEFGPQGQLHTRIYGVGTLSPDGTWTGTLYLRGGGDPTFGDAAFNHDLYGAGANIQLLVARLKSAGVKSIDGSIIGDGSYFDSLGGGPDTGYKASLETEGELDGLAYDAGFTSRAEVALQPHPVLTAATALAAAMRAAGISVPKSTQVGTGVTPSGARQLAQVGSPSLSKLVQLTNSPSDNFFAETLLKDLGAAAAAPGTTAEGAAVVRSIIGAHLRLHPRLDDGSGLSRYDRTTANQVVSLLRQMRGDGAFYGSLSIAGVRGTMSTEMRHTRAANNCRGKTGTLHDVANLVGYCTARDGHKLVFAFLMNGLPNDADYAHEVEDRMGVALANYNG
jgi:D-alanyl-D-alanine carboxypeptidase/D-alanyl-D-alanine-endopeptidase (penicillin-binding protein 4)